MGIIADTSKMPVNAVAAVLNILCLCILEPKLRTFASPCLLYAYYYTIFARNSGRKNISTIVIERLSRVSCAFNRNVYDVLAVLYNSMQA